MTSPPDALPDDLDALRAALLAERAARAAEQVARHEAEARASGAEAMVAHLKLLIAKLRRERFGASAERGSKLDQCGPLPPHLPRERVAVPGLAACPCCAAR